jgi:hypothetical protein
MDLESVLTLALANEKLGAPKETFHGACIEPFQSIHTSKDKRYLSLHGNEKLHPQRFLALLNLRVGRVVGILVGLT